VNSKSDASGRVVFLDNDITKVLRAHRERQNRARRARGNAWVNSGLVVTNADGSPSLRPGCHPSGFMISDTAPPPSPKWAELHRMQH
jgi:hypothetical protein